MKPIGRRQFIGAGVATATLAGAYHFALGQGLGTQEQSTIKDKRPEVHPDGVRFGAYDPHGDFAQQTNLKTEGLFMPWEDVDLTSLPSADTYAGQRGRDLLVTVEPWSWDKDWRLTSSQLRERILAGGYDANMREIARLIGRMKVPVVVRWAQEMEDQDGRFSWSGWQPDAFVTAYRRMMDIVKKEAPNARLMWSPKGLPGLKAYYPGDGYADLVGLSVFGLEAYDRIAYGKPQTFQETVAPGYKLVEEFAKPVWVAELGYEGSDPYLLAWMRDVTRKYAEFPRLEEVVYFNDKEVHAWPYNLGRPDWRVVRNATV